MILFEIVGIMTCICMLPVVVIFALGRIESILDKLHRKHIYKHRFDKPPMAKCYCVDCKYYSRSGYCLQHSGWGVSDNWFCWSADPYEKEATDNAK